MDNELISRNDAIKKMVNFIASGGDLPSADVLMVAFDEAADQGYEAMLTVIKRCWAQHIDMKS